jgi:alkaline phosphatase D
VVLTLLLSSAACAGLQIGRPPEVRISHGVAVGETSDTRDVLWARCEAPAMLEVSVDDRTPERVPVVADHDLTRRVAVGGLEPGSEHTYRARCGAGPAVSGRFRTAPGPSEAAPVRFAFGGDVGGQNVCRDVVRGYPLFATILDRAPDFFVALGDMVYADGACRADGALGNRQVAGPPPASDLESFRAHWRYNRADPATQRLLASTTYYAVWDDHEVRNDFGPRDDVAAEAPGRHLFEAGETAFREWAPLEDAAPLHRRFRWGRHVEVLLLDTRGQREANAAPDTGREPKSLLGPAQRTWLEAALAASTATWKVVVSSVPMSIPTGEGVRDGWADGGGSSGFERELVAILRAAARDGVRGLVWITTDVHFATGLRYRPFADARDFVVHEFASGPLAAGLFPKETLDPTLRPVRLFFHGPRPGEAPRTLDAALAWFNFGLAEVDAEGRLAVSIVDGTGRTRHRVSLPPPPPRRASTHPVAAAPSRTSAPISSAP